MALKRFREDMRHLLMLAQFSRCEKLQSAQVASESRVNSTMELLSMIAQSKLRAQIANWRALKTNISLKYIKLP